MIRGTLLILIALIIDGLQAGLSLVLAIVTAVPGTALGATGGCAAGNYFLGQIGCAIGGTVLGLVGTLLDPALATFTEPIGIALGFAINICLTITLGAFLLTLMRIFEGKIYYKNLAFGLGEMIPGINNLPFWTAFVVISLLKKNAEDKQGALGAVAGVLSAGSPLTLAAGGIMAMKETTTQLADETGALEHPKLTPEYIRREKNTQDISGERLEAQARASGILGDTQERETLEKTRQIFNDIRPVRKAAAILLMLALAGGAAHVAYAQTVDPIRFVVTPEVPGPNQNVIIEAQGVGTYLGDATITWQENGKTISTGAGIKTFAFSTGGVGAQTKIHVVVQSSTQGTIVRDFNFIPTLVNLLWEADTSVPSLYRGKALYSAGSSVKVVAFPQVVSGGSTISSNNLSFQWTVDGDPVPEQSGKGHSSIVVQGSQLKNSEDMSVDVYLGTSLVGQAGVSIPAVDPEVLLYDKDPLRGTLFDLALPTSVSLLGQEVTLQAQPYFFANDSIANGSLSYTWTLNGAETSGPDSAQGLLTLRQTGSGGGSAQLNVSLQNTDATKFVQQASDALNIIFGGASSGSNSPSAFGL